MTESKESDPLETGLGVVKVFIFIVVVVVGGFGLHLLLDIQNTTVNTGATIGNLGQIRSALSIYYGDMEGFYPQNLDELTVNRKYIESIPKVTVHKHFDTRKVAYYKTVGVNVKDTGRWGYVNDPSNMDYGTLFVDCTHTDIRKGKVWTTY